MKKAFVILIIMVFFQLQVEMANAQQSEREKEYGMAASDALKYKQKINDVFDECLTKDPKYMSDSVLDACISLIENYANHMRTFMAKQSQTMDTILYQ